MSTLALVDQAAGALTPLERLEALCDPGSLRLIRTGVRSERLGDRAAAGDGVLAGAGCVDGRPVACYAEDDGFLGGSLGVSHARTLARLYELAAGARLPVVGFVASAGARLQDGAAALAGYGDLFARIVSLSGSVPQISVVCGVSAGGGAYAPALTDFVVMTEQAAMFLTGPGVVRDVTGEDVDAAGLGGPRVHAANGVCHLVAADDADAARRARDLLSHLPGRAGDPLPRRRAAPPGSGDPRALVPADGRRVYDVRDVAARLVDGGALLEIAPRWARNVVCALARVDGRPVGLVASQPRHLGGVLDAEAAQKAARFVRTCHLFGLPLVTLVDTPGFLPGSGQERSAVIRHGAKLVHAFAEATVPKVTIVLRKSFGGAHIAMSSRELGAHLTFAWPGAQIGVMGAEQAARFVHRRAIDADPDPERAAARHARAYAAEHLSAERAAADGIVDELIAPHETRDRLKWALILLDGVAHEPGPARNVPL